MKKARFNCGCEHATLTAKFDDYGYMEELLLVAIRRTYMRAQEQLAKCATGNLQLSHNLAQSWTIIVVEQLITVCDHFQQTTTNYTVKLTFEPVAIAHTPEQTEEISENLVES